MTAVFVYGFSLEFAILIGFCGLRFHDFTRDLLFHLYDFTRGVSRFFGILAIFATRGHALKSISIEASLKESFI